MLQTPPARREQIPAAITFFEANEHNGSNDRGSNDRQVAGGRDDQMNARSVMRTMAKPPCILRVLVIPWAVSTTWAS